MQIELVLLIMGLMTIRFAQFFSEFFQVQILCRFLDFGFLFSYIISDYS
jgi:hypothetical protein